MWLAEVSHRTHAPWGVSSLYMWSARGGDKKDLIMKRLSAQSVKQVQALKVLGIYTPYLAQVSSYVCVTRKSLLSDL